MIADQSKHHLKNKNTTYIETTKQFCNYFLSLFCREELTPIKTHLFMRSKIRIDVDEFNCPVIRIELVKTDDVRDKLLQRWIEQSNLTGTKIQAVYNDTGALDLQVNSIKVLDETDFVNNPHMIDEGFKVGDEIGYIQS